MASLVERLRATAFDAIHMAPRRDNNDIFAEMLREAADALEDAERLLEISIEDTETTQCAACDVALFYEEHTSDCQYIKWLESIR